MQNRKDCCGWYEEGENNKGLSEMTSYAPNPTENRMDCCGWKEARSKKGRIKKVLPGWQTMHPIQPRTEGLLWMTGAPNPKKERTKKVLLGWKAMHPIQLRTERSAVDDRRSNPRKVLPRWQAMQYAPNPTENRKDCSGWQEVQSNGEQKGLLWMTGGPIKKRENKKCLKLTGW